MDREKALGRLVSALRLAADERTPDGERSAAEARIRKIEERWRFTLPELRRALAARRAQEYPRPAQPARPAPAARTRGSVVGRAYIVVTGPGIVETGPGTWARVG